LDSAPVAAYLASLSTTDSTTDQPSEEELEQ